MVARPWALAVLCAVALGGCGGADGSTPRAQFVKQADAICGPALKELKAIAARIDAVAAGGDPAVIFSRSAALIRRAQVVTARAFDRIDALDRPAGDRDAIQGWVAGNRRQNALSGQLAAAFQAQDQKRIAVLSEEIDELNTANDASARKLGARACAAPV